METTELGVRRSWMQYPAAWQKVTGTSVTFSGTAPGYTHCFQVRGVDKLGNGAWSTVQCAAAPPDRWVHPADEPGVRRVCSTAAPPP
jgi:hypothetical protein